METNNSATEPAIVSNNKESDDEDTFGTTIDNTAEDGWTQVLTKKIPPKPPDPPLKSASKQPGKFQMKPLKMSFATSRNNQQCILNLML